MAIKLSSKNQDNIPTLTEVVTEGDGHPSQPEQPPQHSNAKNNTTGLQLPPKFERVLEKLIYKKLHPQLVTTSQILATEIVAELQKYLQTADKIQNKADKNQD